MQRTSSIKGTEPILIIVPHGHDDPNTSIVAEQIIKELDAYGVINYGWERADKYDYYEDRANCNNITHIHEDVIKEEFLDPILDFTDRILNVGNLPNIFIIHGVSNSIRNTFIPTDLDLNGQIAGGLTDSRNLDIIVGGGQGVKPSLSCPEWYRNLFMQYLGRDGFNTWDGAEGGAYSGRGHNNLNQLFRSWKNYQNDDVFSVQLEIVRARRETKDIAEVTGDRLAMAIEDVVDIRNNPSRAVNFNLLNFPKI